MNASQVISWLPHFKDHVPSQYKQVRNSLNDTFGNLTLLVTLLLIFCYPIKCFISQILLQSSSILRIHHMVTKRFKLIHKFVFHSSTAKIIIFWTLLSSFLSFYKTFDDLLFISKRLGRVCCASFPAILFLTLRPSPLPKTLYLSLLPIHKWLSRIIVIEGLAHTVIYLFYFKHNNTMYKIKKPGNIHGIIAIIAFIIIGLTSLPRIRRLYFKVFYFLHYSLTWICVICLQLHAKPNINIFTIINVSILVYQIIYRVSITSTTTVTITNISPSLALLEFPSADITKKTSLPAAHLRINNAHKNIFKNIFYHIIPLQHPFTISSLPNDYMVKLIIRRGQFPLKNSSKYFITGSFDPTLDFIKEYNLFNKIFFNTHKRLSTTSIMNNYEIDANRVLIVVGGSGISFGIPLLRILNYNGITARLIWVSKDLKDLNLLNHFKGLQNIECYITGDYDENDIVIDYYEDDKLINKVQPLNYGAINNTFDENDDEIDFTNSLSFASTKKKVPRKSLSALRNLKFDYKEHENVNIDISNQCKHGICSPYSSKSGTPPAACASAACFVGTTSTSSTTTPNYQDHENSPEFDIPPESFNNIKISKSIKIFYGRPNLGADHYEWCLQSHCVGPAHIDGEDVCCRDLGPEEIDKSKIWVVAAGPSGLVEHTSQWAKDGGLRCHVESFAV